MVVTSDKSAASYISYWSCHKGLVSTVRTRWGDFWGGSTSVWDWLGLLRGGRVKNTGDYFPPKHSFALFFSSNIRSVLCFAPQHSCVLCFPPNTRAFYAFPPIFARFYALPPTLVRFMLSPQYSVVFMLYSPTPVRFYVQPTRPSLCWRKRSARPRGKRPFLPSTKQRAWGHSRCPSPQWGWVSISERSQKCLLNLALFCWKTITSRCLQRSKEFGC